MGLVFDGYYIWVANLLDNSLTRIQPETLDVQTIDISALGSRPYELTFDGASLWFSLRDSNGIGSYHISKGEVGEFIFTNLSTRDILFDGTFVWVSNYANNSVSRVSVATGFGQSNSTVTKGLYLFGQSGALYCLYVNGSGVLTANTTLTNCQ